MAAAAYRETERVGGQQRWPFCPGGTVHAERVDARRPACSRGGRGKRCKKSC